MDSNKDPIESLQLPDRYPHATEPIESIETHISRVFLAGDWAYKIKKPVRFEFLDYSTAALRQRLCERELEINRRFAPDLYVDVVPIRDSPQGWTFLGSGPIVEHAVRMRRFSQDEMALPTLESDSLAPESMIGLADRLAEYHRAAPDAAGVSADVGNETIEPLIPPRLTRDMQGVDALVEPAFRNVRFLVSALSHGSRRDQMRGLETWFQQQVSKDRSRFLKRLTSGRVRECHGDLHLGNLLYRNGQWIAFDAIEFNESFRRIDVASELAFLAMDLEERGFAAHAHRLIDRYLEVSGDYDAAGMLPFYLTYRALVRAKVDLLRQRQTTGDPQAGFSSTGQAYADLAQVYARRRTPELWITFGPSGSGKSVASARIVEHDGFLRLRSDVFRKRRVGLAPEADSRSAFGQSLYTSTASDQTYLELAATAEQLLQDGFSVIVDATFLQRQRRQFFRGIAERIGVTFRILQCMAPVAELRYRVAHRTGDASEATLEVLERQLETLEPLDSQELACLV